MGERFGSSAVEERRCRTLTAAEKIRGACCGICPLDLVLRFEVDSARFNQLIFV